MKTVLLSTILLVAQLCAGQTDDRKWAVALAQGMGSGPFFEEAKANNFSPIQLPVFGEPGLESSGVTSLSILRKLNNKLQVGTLIAYQRIKANYSLLEVSYDLDVFSIMPSVQYYHVVQNAVAIYSGAAAGIAFKNRKTGIFKNNFTTVSYQLTLAGLRIGKRFAFIMEVGYGYKGILASGFSCRF